MQLGWVALLLAVAAGCKESAAPHGERPKDPPQAKQEGRPPLVGVHSCSGRGCHAAFEQPGADPSPSRSSFTRWLHHDPHARAYQVLLEPLAQKMGKELGVDVTTEPRCLVCHCTPPLASRNDDWARQERTFGVGCEACHGPARDWLAPHPSAAWQHMLGEEKQEKYGLTNLGSQAVRAGVCAGCHVGAPADPANGLSARDMNHDFIAAGHPRLMFEYSAFLANEPKHWKEKDARPDFDVRAWLVGQAVTAKAALDLLADRAGADADRAPEKGPGRPWPELSEYDCYACHHTLDRPAWRQRRGYPAKPGSLEMSQWAFALLPVAERAANRPATNLAGLRRQMREPVPPAPTVRRDALALAKSLAALATQLEKKTYNKAAAARLRKDLIAAYRPMDMPDWDVVEQVVLGLQALQTADPDPRRAQVVQDLLRKLAFPPAHNSPAAFQWPPVREKDLDALFGKLGN
jgi:hypothetical protein